MSDTTDRDGALSAESPDTTTAAGGADASAPEDTLLAGRDLDAVVVSGDSADSAPSRSVASLICPPPGRRAERTRPPRRTPCSPFGTSTPATATCRS
jgi:hypothetical protein